MNIDPFKMLFYGFIVIIVLVILAYYSIKLSIEIINDEYFIENNNEFISITNKNTF